MVLYLPDGYILSEVLSLVGLMIFMKASLHHGLFTGAWFFGAGILLKLYCLLMIIGQTH
jgi:hypothetical protein